MLIKNIGDYPISDLHINELLIEQTLDKDEEKVIIGAYSKSIDLNRKYTNVFDFGNSEFVRSKHKYPKNLIFEFNDLDNNSHKYVYHLDASGKTYERKVKLNVIKKMLSKIVT